MTFAYADRVHETVSNKPNAAGTFTLSGAKPGMSTFASPIGTDVNFTYCAHEVDSNGNPSGAWELGVGSRSGTTVTRHYVTSSTNSNAAVDFSAITGSLEIFVTDDATRYRDLGGALYTPLGSNWSNPGFTATAMGNTWTSIGLTLGPVVIQRPAILLAMRSSVLAAKSTPGTARHVWYHAANDMWPGELAILCGEYAVDSIGIKRTVPSPSPLILPGRYWVGIQSGDNAHQEWGSGSGGNTTDDSQYSYGVGPYDPTGANDPAMASSHNRMYRSATHVYGSSPPADLSSDRVAVGGSVNSSNISICQFAVEYL